MPQDELWATSARLKGWFAGYHFNVGHGDHDLFSLTPTWSKVPPSNRQGNVNVNVPSYMRDYAPQLLRSAHYELTGGLACNVAGVVQAQLREIQEGFLQGTLH